MKSEVKAEEIINKINQGENIDIDNSIIFGELILTKLANREIENNINITNTAFECKVDFSHLIFSNKVNLSGSFFKRELICSKTTFKDEFICDQIISRKNIIINGSKFYSKAIFSNSHIEGKFYSKTKETESQKTIFYDEVSFKSTKFEKMVEFDNTYFEKEVTFANTQFYSYTYFSGVEFSNKVSFNDSKFLRVLMFRAKVDSDNILSQEKIVSRAAIFRDFVDFMGAIINRIESNGCHFYKQVNLSFVRVERGILFDDCHFYKNALFKGIIVNGDANFRNCHFHSFLNFNNCHFLGIADFTGSHFGNENNPNKSITNNKYNADTIFIGAIFENVGIFNNCHFNNNISFKSCSIKGNACFNNSNFSKELDTDEKTKNNYIDFIGFCVEGTLEFDNCKFYKKFIFIDCQVGGNTSFKNAHFYKKAKFIGTIINSRLELKDAIFYDQINFRNANFSMIKFSEEQKPDFPKGIDLQNCKYEQIQPIQYWESFMKNMEPYNRKAYIQLEMIARNLGKDALANEIYRKREDKYNEEIKKKIKLPNQPHIQDRLELYKNQIWKCLSGYGTQTWRTVTILLLFWLIGTIIFTTSKKAVILKDPDEKSVPTIEKGLPIGDAAWLTADLILPIEVPRTAWKPSYNFWIISCPLPWNNITGKDEQFGIRYIDIARFLNLSGWIAVPIGIGSLTGLLKNDK